MSAVVLLMTAGLAIPLVLHELRSRNSLRLVRLVAVAGAVNGAVAPLGFLNLQSDVLLCVPLAVLLIQLREESDPAIEMVLGLILGIVFVDGFLPVAQFTGVSHVALPAALAVLLAAGVAIRFPWLRQALTVALPVNLLLAFILPPSASVWLSMAVSLMMLALLLVRSVPGLRQRTQVRAWASR